MDELKAWFLAFQGNEQKRGAMTLKWSGTDFVHKNVISTGAYFIKPTSYNLQVQVWVTYKREKDRQFSCFFLTTDLYLWIVTCRLYEIGPWNRGSVSSWTERNINSGLVLFTRTNICNRFLFLLKFSSFMRLHTSDSHTYILALLDFLYGV